MVDLSLLDVWTDAHRSAPEAVTAPPTGPARTGTGDEIDDRTRLAAIGIDRVVHDSRRVVPGSLFACVRGESFDGHEFAVEAVGAGAAALLVDRALSDNDSIDAPIVAVSDVRAAMPWFAASVAGHPSRALVMIGITGTNGKTTTTHLIASIIRAAGSSCRVIGTLSGARTTPESTELQPMLASFLAEGTDVVAMEVSSHALDQHRADAITFDVAVFTNLTPDHLDYHETMREYFDAKAVLFDGRTAAALVNADDEWGAELIRQLGERQDGPAVHPWSLDDVEITDLASDHTVFVWRGAPIRLPLAGRFNVANALAAAEAARLCGIDDDAIRNGLEQVEQIPGRMEIALAPSDSEPCVLVDYSHTPDSIDQAIRTCRELVADNGRVIIVFGAGGDRDRTKRPLMGAAAAAADICIVTSDNPRSEDPVAIIDDVLTGFTDDVTGSPPTVEPDRRQAIRIALDTGRPGDVILVAGKGHEATQTIAGVAHPFSDREVVVELHQELRA